MSSAPAYRVVMVATLALAGDGLGLSGGLVFALDEPPSKEGATHSRTIAEVRGLVAELEEQAERQRSQLRKSEASLQRARALLKELEDAPSTRQEGQKQPHPQFAPRRDERSLPDQAEAEKKEWKWADDRANPQASARQLGDDCKVQIAPTKGEPGSLTFTLTREGQADYSWDGHEHSVFVRGGDVLYRADFHPHTHGCAVIAYDLKAGKLLWKTHLWTFPIMGQVPDDPGQFCAR